MNKEKLLELADYIEKIPQASFGMSDWMVGNEDAPCGTTACIAGHACLHFLLKGKLGAIESAITTGIVLFKKSSITISNAAMTILGLTEDQAYTLFYATHWPSEWREKYYTAEWKGSTNKIAAKFIREFVKTNGFERKEPR